MARRRRRIDPTVADYLALIELWAWRKGNLPPARELILAELAPVEPEAPPCPVP